MTTSPLLLTLLQAPAGPFFQEPSGFSPLATLLKLIALVVALVVALGALRTIFEGVGGLFGDDDAAAPEEHKTSAAAPPRPALITCEFCSSRLTSNRLTESGGCPRCGAPVTP